MKYMKRYTVTFTVEGVPGDPMTKVLYDHVGATRKRIQAGLTSQYGGRKVKILELHPSHS
jgi:hypothetical protein